jgi:hypothetical protein
MRTLMILLLVAGCGDDGGGGTHLDAPSGTQDAPATGTALTVKNVLSWCSIAANGGTETTGDLVVHVPPGEVTLTAKGAGQFVLGAQMWHHTDGTTDNTGVPGTVTGSGASATSTAKVTVGTTAKCVWVCCPFANGSGCEVGAPDNRGDPCN